MEKSTFLFARPSFLEGLARAFDFGGTLQEYNLSRTGAEADLRALQADVQAVGEDLKEAVRLVMKERAVTR
jgi:hypothetical protein